MYDEMYVQTNTGGMLPTLKDNYEEIISNIDKRIEREDRRLKLVRDRYKERFARLEATLAKLNAQSESIKSQIAKLPKIGSASG
jgi:flagellar capping protein FliD